MKIAVDKIKVDKEDRIRLDIGDLAGLRESIMKVGLLNPILVDEKYLLIAGYRRLAACRELGWREVEARIVPFEGDLLRELDAEVAENIFRKDFTPEEIMRIEQRRRAILRKLRGNIFKRIWRFLIRIWKRLFGRKSQPSPTESRVGEKLK